MILGFSTSGPYCGAALYADGDVIAGLHEELAKGQAERLMPMIEEVLADAGASYADLDAIGVGAGPGNFTGIRIAVSAARGLALGLGIPAVGVSMLEALALGHSGPALTSIAAGRDQLYLQRFAPGAARGPELVPFDAIEGWHLPDLTCIGNRAADIAARLEVADGPAPFYPASAVARIAASRWQDDPPRPAPIYLRPADAAPPRDAPPKILP
ncbi:tRNA (adenosine(37)-N6)-threonylcarbamoyltransferase complex dimerization subunit type 1 TsaB [Sulfitobacter aestuariivivens]|uniref:tRNA (Adenosine(37)-N6)-threonylcarbamoyltransferase complex dimerization subunit type 1 TsaB n=1 Tax=Sulfitobacter aestuariivivens TaxID=2766981 RepID=A0A927HG76_9RHOB|nr:tRNA (adenosine(37)-N6)-threonylcarbamoyltransferase complex dimerization subunit type 1 TsaB [Sulfitobacter aestuariivivens]MBD3663970.1 tRNA (adenosine(37)-N6)-threonylcarbamoyltransferase complex dimerization subunit type 1 TsaB [Sulfitobacter aestuariivivens]